MLEGRKRKAASDSDSSHSHASADIIAESRKRAKQIENDVFKEKENQKALKSELTKNEAAEPSSLQSEMYVKACNTICTLACNIKM